MQSDKTAIVLGILSAITVLIAWVFRYRIAEISKGKIKAPQEVLFEGYEKLLGQYQTQLIDRDGKIAKLEVAFQKTQDELDKAKVLIQEMRAEDARKATIIRELEVKLDELKALHLKEQANATD